MPQVTHLKKGQSQIRCDIWEENSRALVLTNLKPGRSTARSKHFGVALHWFRSKLRRLDKGKTGRKISLNAPRGSSGVEKVILVNPRHVQEVWNWDSQL
eukprot:580487-Ditylum_brightwellii.AAC.1